MYFKPPVTDWLPTWSSVMKSNKSLDSGIQVPDSLDRQAFRLLEVLDGIASLQHERNLLQVSIQKTDGLHVAHGPDFDVVIDNGHVTKAKHANKGQALVNALNADAPAGKVVNGALQAALVAAGNKPQNELQMLEQELRDILKRILDFGYVPSVLMNDDHADLEIHSPGFMYVARKRESVNHKTPVNSIRPGDLQVHTLLPLPKYGVPQYPPGCRSATPMGPADSPCGDNSDVR
jgi:hypothetical protein